MHRGDTVGTTLWGTNVGEVDPNDHPGRLPAELTWSWHVNFPRLIFGVNASQRLPWSRLRHLGHVLDFSGNIDTDRRLHPKCGAT